MDVHRIRVHLHFLPVRGKGEINAPLLRDGKGITYPLVVGIKAHDAAQQRPICTMPPIGAGKGTVKDKFHPDQRPGNHFLSQIGDSGRSRRVGAGRADHIRTQHVKDTDKRHSVTPFRFVIVSV